MKKECLSFGVTGFIDILGFGAKVLEANISDESSSDLDRIIESVTSVRKFFIEDYSVDDDGSHENGVTSLAFSDSIIFNIPLDSALTKISSEFDIVMSEISSLAYSQALCIFNNFFVRGGVDLGWWYKDKNILISQSLTRAYLAEGAAKFPIIIVTKEFENYFKNHSGTKDYANNPFPGTFRELELQCSRNETETYLYLDYINLCIQAITPNHEDFKNEIIGLTNNDEIKEIEKKHLQLRIENWFTTHSSKISEAYNTANDQKVKEKYLWLKDYHNEIVVKYTQNPDCFCQIE